MGLMDSIKSTVTKQVDGLLEKHGDKVAAGMNKAGEAVAKKAAAKKKDPHGEGHDHSGDDERHDIGGSGQGPVGPLP